ASIDPWIWALSDRGLPPTGHWSTRLSWWRASALARLAHTALEPGRLPATLRGRLCDLLHVPGGAPAAQRRPDAPPAPAVAALRERLAGRGARDRYPGLDGRPVVLHILHGWGGGSERFVRDYIAADTRFDHLVLRP